MVTMGLGRVGSSNADFMHKFNLKWVENATSNPTQSAEGINPKIGQSKCNIESGLELGHIGGLKSQLVYFQNDNS